MKISRTGVIVSVLPSFVMLLLFYSLAVHMFYTLGGWPTSIGERGFPRALVLHGWIDMWFCVLLLWSILFVVPFPFLACCAVRRWRRFLPYFAFYAASYFVALAAMQLAPAPFVYWWWD